jgi:hypothetical protein
MPILRIRTAAASSLVIIPSEADGALSNNHGRHQSLVPMIWFIRARAPDRQA